MAASRQRARVQEAPPEVTYFRLIQNSIGNDPLVTIDPLNEQPRGVFNITIRVKGLKKARALATLLVLNLAIGGTRIRVRVRTADGKLAQPVRRTFTAAETAALYTAAFRTNRLFSFASTRLIFGRRFAYPVFKACIVQFFNDDLSDFYQNYNNLAAFVFRSVLRNRISGRVVQFSTALKKSTKRA